MTKKPHEQQPSSNESANANEKRVIGLEEAGENNGVEDTPYNAPEEVEAQKKTRNNVPDLPTGEQP